MHEGGIVHSVYTLARLALDNVHFPLVGFLLGRSVVTAINSLYGIAIGSF